MGRIRAQVLVMDCLRFKVVVAGLSSPRLCSRIADSRGSFPASLLPSVHAIPALRSSFITRTELVTGFFGIQSPRNGLSTETASNSNDEFDSSL
jgi:hypothetical protein